MLGVVMHRELVERVAATTGLSVDEAQRVVGDVIAYFREPAEDFVRRRHADQQTVGLKNADIFSHLQAELAERVVSAPTLSERQLRRIVYS